MLASQLNSMAVTMGELVDDFNNDNMDVVTLIECIERLMSLSLNGIE